MEDDEQVYAKNNRAGAQHFFGGVIRLAVHDEVIKKQVYGNHQDIQDTGICSKPGARGIAHGKCCYDKKKHQECKEYNIQQYDSFHKKVV